MNAAALRQQELYKAINEAKNSQNETFVIREKIKKQKSEISLGLNKKLKNKTARENRYDLPKLDFSGVNNSLAFLPKNIQ